MCVVSYKKKKYRKFVHPYSPEKGVGSGSIGQRYVSADPDPHQNVTDPQRQCPEIIVIFRHGWTQWNRRVAGRKQLWFWIYLKTRTIWYMLKSKMCVVLYTETRLPLFLCKKIIFQLLNESVTLCYTIAGCWGLVNMPVRSAASGSTRNQACCVTSTENIPQVSSKSVWQQHIYVPRTYLLFRENIYFYVLHFKLFYLIGTFRERRLPGTIAGYEFDNSWSRACRSLYFVPRASYLCGPGASCHSICRVSRCSRGSSRQLR